MGGVKTVCLNRRDSTVLLQDWRTTLIQSTKGFFFLFPFFVEKRLGKCIFLSSGLFRQALCSSCLLHCRFLPAYLRERGKKTESNYTLTLSFCVSARHITHSFVHKRHSGLTTIFSCQRENGVLNVIVVAAAVGCFPSGRGQGTEGTSLKC